MARTANARRGTTRDDIGERVLEQLRRCPNGLSKAELIARVGNPSPPTMQRVLDDLRDGDAPIVFDRRTNKWVLRDPRFRNPLDHPEPEDLLAVLMAQAMLGPVADDELELRIGRLVEQLDEKLRTRAYDHEHVATRGVAGTVTLGTKVDAQVLFAMFRTLRSGVVRILYYSPWKHERSRYTIEPWQVRMHDGALYVRAFCRESNQPRTFRAAHIEHVSVLHAAIPSAPAPAWDRVWGNGDPAYGIDHNRPGTAVLRIRGAVARWLFHVKWSPAQHDRWLIDDELLERTVQYTSCREMARRVLGIIDAIESIEPAELQGEVATYVRAWTNKKPDERAVSAPVIPEPDPVPELPMGFASIPPTQNSPSNVDDPK